MKHEMKLHREPFENIKSGIKTIELRLYDEKRRAISVGDEIEFVNADSERLLCKVVAVHIFDSFESLYRALPLTKCGYTKEEAESASSSDMAQYYTPDEQRRFGVVGIEFILI